MSDKNHDEFERLQDHSINVTGNVEKGAILNTGSLTLQYSKDTVENIKATFAEKTASALRYSRPEIEGLSGIIARAEVRDIENLVGAGESVLVIGEPGTGKSGLSHLLVQNAKKRGQGHLILNCRFLQSVATEQNLKDYLSLDAYSLVRACLAAKADMESKDEPFLLVVDQLDSVLGVTASQVILEAALGCHDNDEICVVVFSRSGEAREKSVIEFLTKARFKPIFCEELTDATDYLSELGIASPTQELHELARNLLHLSLIAKIKQENPDVDFSALTNEAALWEERIKVFKDQHQVNGEALVAELSNLAERALKSDKGTFLLDEPPAENHEPLLSEKFIRRQYSHSDICLFTHERMQDFLYARRLLRQGKNAAFATRELGPFRAQSIHIWLDKIAKANNVPDRETILRTLFDV